MKEADLVEFCLNENFEIVIMKRAAGKQLMKSLSREFTAVAFNPSK